jgi:hypothetical protein
MSMPKQLCRSLLVFLVACRHNFLWTYFHGECITLHIFYLFIILGSASNFPFRFWWYNNYLLKFWFRKKKSKTEILSINSIFLLFYFPFQSQSISGAYCNVIPNDSSPPKEAKCHQLKWIRTLFIYKILKTDKM